MSEEGILVRAFILHVRKFRDTSVIVELLTEAEGRVAAVMRGVRSRKSKTASHVRPFTQVLVSWFGRGELKTVRTMDFPLPSANLSGDRLVLGLYVNELLVRLVGKSDPVPDIFSAYGELLVRLERDEAAVPALRRFELLVLSSLGYGITFDVEASSGEAVRADGLYRYVPEEGFYRHTDGVAEPGAQPASAGNLFRGEDLLSIALGDLEKPGVERCARHIVRESLAVLLGGRELKSRELFRRLEGSV